MKKEFKPLFESKTCSRCGGSGQYSYCQMHGTRCFKCGGNGVTLTKRGATAQRFYTDSLMVRADEVQIGDEILIDNFFGNGGFSRVFRIALDEANPGMIILDTEKLNYGTSPDSPVRIRHKKGEILALQKLALEFQATLTKTGQPAKIRSRKAA
jgi:hypothetical protein